MKNPTRKTHELDEQQRNLRPLAEGELDDTQLEAVSGGNPVLRKVVEVAAEIVLEKALEPAVDKLLEPWSPITPYLPQAPKTNGRRPGSHR